RIQKLGLELEISEAALNGLAAIGFDPRYGARPLKRAIQQRIENPLATELLKRSDEEQSRVEIGYIDGDFTFEIREQASPRKETESASTV
ncbi:MAG: hypothetical protein KDA83_06460, partial [Planctomycetales bacterium]|nr:hypothetical protein [Planctomycetales bacterium]